MLVTYSAGLITNLFWASLIHKHDPLFDAFHSLEELVSHPDNYKFFTVRDGSTYAYLTLVARGKEFDQIRNYLTSPDGQKTLVSSTKEGIEKIRSGNYAMIMESMTAKYISNQLPCDLTTVGQQFALRSYGMAMPRNSDIHDDFDKGILELKELGIIEYLENKWFTDYGQCWNVSKIENQITTALSLALNEPKKINMSMFWGPLVLIISGIIISILVCVVEVLWYKYRGRVSTCPFISLLHSNKVSKKYVENMLMDVRS